MESASQAIAQNLSIDAKLENFDKEIEAITR
jgi:hypothetical protein